MICSVKHPISNIISIRHQVKFQRQISLSSGHPVETFFCFCMSNNMQQAFYTYWLYLKYVLVIQPINADITVEFTLIGYIIILPLFCNKLLMQMGLRSTNHNITKDNFQISPINVEKKISNLIFKNSLSMQNACIYL